MCFWENAVGYLKNSECYSFQTIVIVFCTPETLLVGISGALGTKGSCFLSKNVFWENSSGVCYKQWGMPELSNHCHCVLHTHETLLVGISWSSRNKWKPLSQLKHVLRKCCGVSQKQWVIEFSYHCHCVLYRWKLTSRDFWSSMNKRKPFSKQKDVLRKCCGVSQIDSEC